MYIECYTDQTKWSGHSSLVVVLIALKCLVDRSMSSLGHSTKFSVQIVFSPT